MEVEERLEVYKDRSKLVRANGKVEEFLEGPSSDSAKERIKKLKDTLDAGFFENIVSQENEMIKEIEGIDENLYGNLKFLVDSVTSEYGRAVVALTVFQLTIKAIVPEQSVRLHKGSSSRGSFSWIEGIPMRSIDKKYITPILRRNELISLNADGMFMTRSLAENYPYSKVYKAEIKGPREQWHSVIDYIEDNPNEASRLLKVSIGLLRNRSNYFRESVKTLISNFEEQKDKFDSIEFTSDFIMNFIESSGYSARVFEIALHSLFQVLDEYLAFDGILQPLGQMRTANKKKGNIGDLEISEDEDGTTILESWDAKYGKTYLREEIEEMFEKFKLHPNLAIVGFVTNLTPDFREEILQRISEIQEISNIEIKIFDFNTWVEEQIKRIEITESELSLKWATYFIDCIAQRRREVAPIDEPCDNWVKELIKLIDELKSR
jgi:hypothetical protein